MFAEVFQMKNDFKGWGNEKYYQMKIHRVDGTMWLKQTHLSAFEWEVTVPKQEMIEVRLPNLDLAKEHKLLDEE